MNRLRLLASLAAGIVFGLGLGISQMTNPNKVLSFLDFFGAWDPSLALVMGSALGLNIFVFRAILRRPAPAFDLRFHLPEQKTVDAKLIGGSALFGLGWGLSGFCPGAAIAAVPSGLSSAVIFLAAMAGGMALFRAYEAIAGRLTVPAELAAGE